MMQKQTYALQVIIASGPEALGRAVLGFAFALSAATSGVNVVVILALDGTAWAKNDIPAARQSVNGFATIADYIGMLEDSNAIIRICSNCIEKNCTIDKTKHSNAGTTSYVGLTEVAIRATCDAVQTIIF
jgi:predicted peroxiredoxin